MAHIKLVDQAGPLRTRVYHSLRTAILDGQLEPGQKLSEVELASSLSVSRTPVREAFRQLESEGLVCSEPHRGVVVHGLSLRELAQMYVARQALEVQAVRLAAECEAGEEALEKLSRSVDLQCFLVERGRLDDFVRESDGFHAGLNELSGNHWLSLLLGQLRDLEHNLRGFGFRSNPGAATTVCEEHAGQLQAIRQGDAALAEELTRRHLRSTFQRALGADFEALARSAG